MGDELQMGQPKVALSDFRITLLYYPVIVRDEWIKDLYSENHVRANNLQSSSPLEFFHDILETFFWNDSLK
jgi:hypothetical protein